MPTSGALKRSAGGEAERVRSAVRDAEATAERLRHRVRERESRGRERGAGVHRAAQEPRPRLDVVGALEHRAAAPSAIRLAPCERVPVARVVAARGVERLGAVRERVHRRPPVSARRQAERQLDGVDDPLDARAAASALHPPLLVAHAEHRRPLGAGVRRRHRDDGQVECAPTAPSPCRSRSRRRARRARRPRRAAPRPRRRSRRDVRRTPVKRRNTGRSSVAKRSLVDEPRLGDARARAAPPAAGRGPTRRSCGAAVHELDERLRDARRRPPCAADEEDLPRRLHPLDPRERDPSLGDVGLDRDARDERRAVPFEDGARAQTPAARARAAPGGRAAARRAGAARPRRPGGRRRPPA